tara:strand:- start:519 stop:1421 length:903 start_codon:yes stop_codon:yes gene_type:complete
MLNKKNNPLVSIVIPTYNRANFLKKAIDSVLNQTYSKLELIIVDDHSTDNTDKIISSYNDERLKYLKNNSKGIIASSRNMGIRNSRGEWIAFLDSDDWWTLDKLEICLKDINEETDFIYHDLEIIYDKTNSFLKRRDNIGRELKKPILNDLLIGGINVGNAIGNSSVIVRKNILTRIGGINENKNLVASEDYNTWLRIAKITDKFKYFKKKLGYYLVHDNSVQKRDLSIPHRIAVNDFMEFFNKQQKLSLEVKLRYMSGNYNVIIKNYTRAKQDFMFVLKNAGIKMKIRSFMKTILIILK